MGKHKRERKHRVGESEGTALAVVNAEPPPIEIVPAKPPTWQELIAEYGESAPPRNSEYSKLGRTWKEVVIASAFRRAVEGSALVLHTLMVHGNLQVDVNDVETKILNPAERERIISRIVEQRRAAEARSGAGRDSGADGNGGSVREGEPD